MELVNVTNQGMDSLNSTKELPAAQPSPQPAPEIPSPEQIAWAEALLSSPDVKRAQEILKLSKQTPKIPKGLKSSCESPCKLVWQLAYEAYEAAGKDLNSVKRADVLSKAELAGVHPLTARTQYQAWRREILGQ